MPDTTSTIADHVWGTIVPVLEEYLAIPNVSMVFDPEWRSHGRGGRPDRRVVPDRAIPGMTVEVVELDGRSPRRSS